MSFKVIMTYKRILVRHTHTSVISWCIERVALQLIYWLDWRNGAVGLERSKQRPRLAKLLHSQKVSVTWAEKIDQKLASVLVPETMSWATATRSTRKCKTRMEKIGGSHLLWTGEEAMKKGIPILKRAGIESVEDLPRTAVGLSSKAYQDLPPQLRLSFRCGTRTLSWIEPKNWWRRPSISMQDTLLQSLTGVAQLKKERRQEDDSVNR